MPEVKQKRSAYILPSLLTTGGMFCGFYAIIAALTGRYEEGAIAIIAAGIFDGLDGRVARALNAVSAFGKEYDSLADFLSFGMAPALLIYQWALTPFHRLGWAGAFLFTVCGALRLARFNVAHYVGDERISKRYFQGLPIPAAAFILSATVLFYLNFNIESGGDMQSKWDVWRWLPLILVYVLAIFMVSEVRFRSMKDFYWHRSRPFLTLVGVAVLITVLTIHMATTLFIIGWAYLFSALHSHREYRHLLAEGKEVEGDELDDFTA
ncbi:MAG: CDP-diacylglycerol--serine O-phosphatidyltransferase [Magnetococcus sp. DMHC-6]